MMAYKYIEKFYKQQEKGRNTKINLLREQLIECFFTIHAPNDIKSILKASITARYLPTFSCQYKLRSSYEQINSERLVEIVDNRGDQCLLVDYDFANIKVDLHNHDHNFYDRSKQYKRYKKMLGSDYFFKVDGRTEDGNIEINFSKVYRSWLYGSYRYE